MHKRRILGTSIVENCIIIGLVALTSVGILTTFGGTINEVLANCNFKFKEFQPFGKSANAVPVGDPIVGNPIDVDPIDDGVIPPIVPIGAEVVPIDDGTIPLIDGPVGSPPGELDIGVDPTPVDPIALETPPIIPLDPVVPATPGINPEVESPAAAVGG